MSTDTWHHAAVTFDGTNLSLYVDGVLEAQAPRTMEASTGVMWLGRHTDMARHLNGAMDDVVILDRALSASEIGDVMNGRFNPNDHLLAPGTESDLSGHRHQHLSHHRHRLFGRRKQLR